MNAHSMPFSKIISSDQGAHEHYHIPKYQREYTWGNRNWERLLQDIEENDPGYFMGSLICVHDGEPKVPGDEVVYEVVDGQQRLTTLSLLMMAIYRQLSKLQDSFEFADEEDKQDFQNSLSSLRNKLVKKKKDGDFRLGESGGWMDDMKMCYLRVQPSSQNHNLEDYKYLVSDLGLIKRREKPRHYGFRSIARAMRYFQDRLPVEPKPLLALVAKINQLKFVHISVSSQADAFTLFETLNNRGVPLSAIDIIKNKMLAEMEKQHRVNIDESYEKWQDIISEIPESSDQERFLRHVYNTFRWDKLIRVDGIPRAIKSKIISIYEKLIKKDAQTLFDRLCDLAETYGELISPENSKYGEKLQEQLRDLVRINATPGYQVLLYLFSLGPASYSGDDFLSKAVDLVQRYYVRRNVTDFPATRDLDQNHMDLIEICQKRIDAGSTIDYEFLRNTLFKSDQFASYAKFEEALRGSMYSSNNLMTRYLLVKLNETHHSREYAPDLWARNERDNFVWTVEHVLPQTESISEEWIKLIADGDKDKAVKIHEANVDRLGNLTLSGYNSKLSTAPLDKKQALVENRKFLGHSINIGYRNGLALNNVQFPFGDKEFSLASATEWNAEMIEARTSRMVNLILKMYRVEGVD